MASGFKITLVANTPTLISTGDGKLVTVVNGAQSIYLGGSNVDSNNGLPLNDAVIYPITLASGEELWAFSPGVNRDLQVLTYGAAGSGGVQHVVVDSGTITANQGSPNAGGTQAWPTTKP